LSVALNDLIYDTYASHAKIFVFDCRQAFMRSMNFDRRSKRGDVESTDQSRGEPYPLAFNNWATAARTRRRRNDAAGAVGSIVE